MEFANIQMTKIAIISGSGELPILIGNNLIKKKYEIFFLGIKNFVNSELYNNYNYEEISITSFTKILRYLKKNNIDNIIMVGKVNRPSIKDVKFDLNTLSIIKDFLLESQGDDQLLSTISKFFLKKGYPLFDWVNECPELFSNEIYLTKKKPTKKAILNKDKGIKIFNNFGKIDIGQSLIIQNQLVLGIEAIEGTDELINRCAKYKKAGDKGILIKLSKYNQNLYLDVPTIGIMTIENIKRANFEGIYLEKNKCIIINKEKVINFCDKNNLFISTIVKN